MFIHEYPIAIGVPESEQSTRFQNVGLITTRPYAMAMPRLRMRDDWPPGTTGFQYHGLTGRQMWVNDQF